VRELMRIIVVSPRVAPGILTLEAWDALRAADRVLSAEDGPHVQGIRSAGIDVAISPDRPEGGAVDDGDDTVWIAPPGDLAWARELADSLVAGTDDDGPSVEIVLGSHDLPGARLLDLVDVMARLRRECPWTRLQTHESLAPYVMEEAQETFEALESGDSEHLREELGDLLMQVVFQAAVAAEGTPDDPHGWDVDDVAAGITAKLVRRNPHVFAPGTSGTADATTPEEVDAQWNRIKAEEKRNFKGFRRSGEPHG
jgi:XTP/dITP diphosphohydrolase